MELQGAVPAWAFAEDVALLDALTGTKTLLSLVLVDTRTGRLLRKFEGHVGPNFWTAELVKMLRGDLVEGGEGR